MVIVTQADQVVYRPAGFDYESLSPEVRTDVQESARRIRELERRTSESVIEIGQQLIRVKQRLPHGGFLPWLKAEFGWTHETARRFMQVAEVFGQNPQIVEYQPSALYALASNSVPQDLRDDFAAVAEAGEKVTHSAVKQAIAERKTASAGPDAVEDDDVPPFEYADTADPASFIEPIGEEYRAAHPPASTPHVSQNSGENEWYTPAQYIDAAREVMGDIDLDPASADIPQGWIQATTYYTKAENGLARPWYGRVWLNPPYIQPLVQHFTQRVIDEFAAGTIAAAIVLVNNATETKAWQAMAHACTAVCFPQGRIRYLDPSGNPANTPLQGQAFLYFGADAEAFRGVFGKFGVVLP